MKNTRTALIMAVSVGCVMVSAITYGSSCDQTSERPTVLSPLINIFQVRSNSNNECSYDQHISQIHETLDNRYQKNEFSDTDFRGVIASTVPLQVIQGDRNSVNKTASYGTARSSGISKSQDKVDTVNGFTTIGNE
jgi:hypothetical protein